MARIETTTSMYAQLGYNYDDPHGHIQEFSANTTAHLNSMPTIISTWQAEDIATGNVGGYFKNPVSDYANTIITYCTDIRSKLTVANGLIGSTNTITNLFSTIVNSCTDIISTESPSFIQHTMRISGVRKMEDDVIPNPNYLKTKPYYKTATSYGKSAMYITNQTDDISNNSPILGSFTSVMCGPELSNASISISTHAETINASIEYGTWDDGTGNTFIIANSTLTYDQTAQIYSDVANCKTLMYTRRTHDENFFLNLKAFVDDFQETRQFNNMGESQGHLVMNLIGSDKLLERIG